MQHVLLAHGGMSPRNEAILEAVLKRARATKHSWLIACDANMSLEDFEKRLWFRKDRMHVIAPDGASTSRSKNAEENGLRKFMTMSLPATT